MTPGDRQRHLQVFRSAYLFRDLEPEELEPFMEAAGLRSYAQDMRIISEGERGDDLFLVLEGSVRVTKNTPEGLQHVIGLIREGDFFGEMALLDSLPRSASVYAHEAVELALIPRTAIAAIFEERPRTAYRMVRTFAEVLSFRLRETNDRLRILVHLERTF